MSILLLEEGDAFGVAETCRFLSRLSCLAAKSARPLLEHAGKRRNAWDGAYPESSSFSWFPKEAA